MADVIVDSMPKVTEGDIMESIPEGEEREPGERNEVDILTWNPEILEESTYNKSGFEEGNQMEPNRVEDTTRAEPTRVSEERIITTRSSMVSY
jgi:hypothetical protein